MSLCRTHVNEIDKLWVDYSEKYFGFSVQKRIFEKMWENREMPLDCWEKFGEQVGWRERGQGKTNEEEEKKWKVYRNLPKDKTAQKGNLPAQVWSLWFVENYLPGGLRSGRIGGWRFMGGRSYADIHHLFNRLNQ